MNAKVTSALERLESVVGEAGVIQILSEGLEVYNQRLEEFTAQIFAPEGEMARRLGVLARAVDPAARLEFEDTPDGQRLSISSHQAEAIARRWDAELDTWAEGLPGLKRILSRMLRPIEATPEDGR